MQYLLLSPICVSRNTITSVLKKSLKIPKLVIRSRKWKKYRQHERGKMRNNDLQSTTQKTKDQTTRTQLKTGDELRCSGRVGSSCSNSGTRRATIVTKPVIIMNENKNGKRNISVGFTKQRHSSSYWHCWYTSDNVCHDIIGI
jgi:hypothetical protein